MVIDVKKTTVAYRCPKCGCGVMSVVGLFNLSGDMLRLKCDCGGSDMTLVRGREGNVTITAPCMLCHDPHHYTLSSRGFFERDIFSLTCPITGLDTVIMGETERVKAALAKNELELLEMLEKSKIDSFEDIRGEQNTIDPQVTEILTYMIKELDEEGAIHCECQGEGEREFELEFLPDAMRISCKCCGASADIPMGSLIAATAFLETDELVLRKSEK
jgi:hypothetical protein